MDWVQNFALNPYIIQLYDDGNLFVGFFSDCEVD